MLYSEMRKSKTKISLYRCYSLQSVPPVLSLWLNLSSSVFGLLFWGVTAIYFTMRLKGRNFLADLTLFNINRRHYRAYPRLHPMCTPNASMQAGPIAVSASGNGCSRRYTPLLRVRNEKVSLTTTLITKLHTNPLALSRTTADAGVQSSPRGRSTTQVDCRWHGSGQVFESPHLDISWGC